MKFFLDTGISEEVATSKEWCNLSGVTTNPTLIANSGKNFKQAVLDICELLPEGEISAEVVATNYQDMLKEALEIASWSKNIVIKVPLTKDGLMLVRKLSSMGIKTNVTLVFSLTQAHLAAISGATYISIFLGRIDDISYDNGTALLADAVHMIKNYQLNSKILAASIRHPLHVVECIQIGVDACTLPFNVLSKLHQHPLTDIGLERFLADWNKANLTITL